MATATLTIPSTTDAIMPSESTLPASVETKAIQLAKQTTIDPSHPELISTIGAEDQQKSAAISNKLLEHVKVNDTGDSGKLLGLLATKCKSIDVEHLKASNSGRIVHLLHLERFMTVLSGYQDTIGQLDALKAKLETARTTLLTDVASLNTLYEQNLEIYHGLKTWIRVCEIKLVEMDKQIANLTAKISSTKVLGGPDAQDLFDLKAARDRLDKHLHDLELTAMIRLQNAPKIRIVQAGDIVLADKLQSSVVNTMSIWKDNLALAIAQMRQKEALEMENRVDDATNQMLRDSADLLHQNTTGIAKASERGVVDIATLQYTQKQLLATIDETERIAADGRKAREEARKILTTMQSDLQAKLGAR
jgi:uncharacterized protein YaaN involved in tellurite resistance